MHRYCVSVSSDPTALYYLDPANPLASGRFVSQPECRDVKIQWAGRVVGEVRAKSDMPVVGTRLTARCDSGGGDFRPDHLPKA